MKMVSRIIGGSVELEMEFADSLPYINADKGQFEQIFINLIVNARDAVNGNGKILVSTKSVDLLESFCVENSWAKPGKYVAISVEDSGPGIPKENRSKIFDPFYTTKEVGKGTGLGLAIVYSVTSKHNGFVRITESRFKGARFDVYFPVSQLTSELSSRTDENLSKEYEGNETVLLAEDSELVRNFAGRMLRKNGYEVIFATDGLEAVEKFIKNKSIIDILVFDIVMPGQTGKAAYEEIKKIAPNIPVIFCSGYHEEILDTKFFSNFNGAFLAKPYRSVDLLSRIRSIMDLESNKVERQDS
jgi:CheY-like chemotaxis protein